MLEPSEFALRLKGREQHPHDDTSDLAFRGTMVNRDLRFLHAFAAGPKGERSLKTNRRKERERAQSQAQDSNPDPGRCFDMWWQDDERNKKKRHNVIDPWGLPCGLPCCAPQFIFSDSCPRYRDETRR